MEQAGIEEMVP